MILSPAQIAEKCVDIGIASTFGNMFAGKLPAAMIFSAGLVMVLVAGSELFLFWKEFLRGVLCNFLVCIAVWMSFGTSKLTGKVLAVFWPITIFVFCGFEHSIADMYFIPAGIFQAVRTGESPVSVLAFFADNLLPVTLGNIVGGALIVAVGYYLVYIRKPKTQ